MSLEDVEFTKPNFYALYLCIIKDMKVNDALGFMNLINTRVAHRKRCKNCNNTLPKQNKLNLCKKCTLKHKFFTQLNLDLENKKVNCDFKERGEKNMVNLSRALQLINRVEEITDSCVSKEEICLVIAAAYDGVTKTKEVRKIMTEGKIILDTIDHYVAIHNLRNAQKPKEHKEDCKNVEMAYDKRNNTVLIGASEKDFDEKYLKYMIEHLGLPADVKKVFLK